MSHPSTAPWRTIMRNRVWAYRVFVGLVDRFVVFQVNICICIYIANIFIRRMQWNIMMYAMQHQPLRRSMIALYLELASTSSAIRMYNCHDCLLRNRPMIPLLNLQPPAVLLNLRLRSERLTSCLWTCKPRTQVRSKTRELSCVLSKVRTSQL